MKGLQSVVYEREVTFYRCFRKPGL